MMEQTKKGVWVDKRGEKERKREEGKNRGGNEQERDKEREREKKKKKAFRFSLRSTKIGLWVFVRARGKVGPRNEGYAWVPKSKGFVKL